MGQTWRFTKAGKQFCEITISRGRDPLTDKRLSPYSERYYPPEGYSDKKAKKEERRERKEAKLYV